MAITKIGTDVTNTQNNATTFTFSHTLVAGSNRLIVVCTSIEQNPALSDPGVTAVSYGGVAMTRAVGRIGSYNYGSIWYLLESGLGATGSKTVSVTHAGNISGGYGASCMSYAGVSQVAPTAASNYVTNNTTVSNTISTATDAWVISAGVTGSDLVTPTYNNGQIGIVALAPLSQALYVAELRGATGQTSVNITLSSSTARFIWCSAVFKAYVAPSNKRQVYTGGAWHDIPALPKISVGGTSRSIVGGQVYTGGAWHKLF
jgi:hypothetical protein